MATLLWFHDNYPGNETDGMRNGLALYEGREVWFLSRGTSEYRLLDVDGDVLTKLKQLHGDVCTTMGVPEFFDATVKRTGIPNGIILSRIEYTINPMAVEGKEVAVITAFNNVQPVDQPDAEPPAQPGD